jgi:hypothetical protein
MWLWLWALALVSGMKVPPTKAHINVVAGIRIPHELVIERVHELKQVARLAHDVEEVTVAVVRTAPTQENDGMMANLTWSVAVSAVP